MPRLTQENISLKPFNTFGIEATARYFTDLHQEIELNDILELASNKDIPLMILGGGSNVLFTGDYPGMIIHNKIPGIKKVDENKNHIYVEVGSGVNWHSLVCHCIENNYAGVENLSLIPGNVGAAPMQNIGAYGVELKDVFFELRAIELKSGEPRVFNLQDCRLGYRSSVFKQELKGKFIIVSVTLRLNKVAKLNTSYGAIETELARMGVKQAGIKEISEAVCNIRRSKLPDPAITGNAGSFFKNPSISEDHFLLLKEKHPDLVAYKNPDGSMKIAAGWLIEQCGWKGKSIGNAGVHKNQALVLVNLGGAKGSEIYSLAKAVCLSVHERFGIELEMEVNLIC